MNSTRRARVEITARFGTDKFWEQRDQAIEERRKVQEEAERKERLANPPEVFDGRPKCEYCNDVLVVRGDYYVCPRGHYAEERPRIIYGS